MCIIRFPGIFFILLCYGLVELLQTVEEGVDGEELVEEEAEESENYSIAVRLQDLEEGVQQLSEQDRRRGEIERPRRQDQEVQEVLQDNREEIEGRMRQLLEVEDYSFAVRLQALELQRMEWRRRQEPEDEYDAPPGIPPLHDDQIEVCSRNVLLYIAPGLGQEGAR